MKKYLGKVSYNGANYYGFQRQSELPSIQAELERALSELLGSQILIKGAGRTDAGVHALGQRFSFESEKSIEDLEGFRLKFNRLLPVDIAIFSLEEVPLSFDARHSSRKKEYLYLFAWGERDPLLSQTVAQLGYYPFDEDALRKGLAHFEGTHDFSNFTSKQEDVGNFIRTIDWIKVDIDQEKKRGSVLFHGDGFMTYMVRLIMGCAFKCAKGSLSPDEVPALIDRKPRHIVSFKAPAAGLYLKDVIYD